MVKLENISRRKAIGLTGLGLAGVLSGCAAVSKNETEAITGAVMMQSNNPQEALLGTVLYLHGTMKHQKDIALEGRTEVNVNIGQKQEKNGWEDNLLPEYNLEKLKEQYIKGNHYIENLLGSTDRGLQDGFHCIFTYRDHIDLNQSNSYSFNEFNIKRNFKEGEPVNIAVNYSASPFLWSRFNKPKPLNIKISSKILNEKNEIIMEKNYEEELVNRKNRRLLLLNLGKNFDPGIYSVKCEFFDNHPETIRGRAYRLKMKKNIGTVFNVLE